MRKIMSSLVAAGVLALGAGAVSAETIVSGAEVAPRGSDVFYVKYDTDGDGSLADEQMVLRTRAELEAERDEVILYENHAVEAVDLDGDGQIDTWVMESQAMRGSLDLDNNGIPDGDE